MGVSYSTKSGVVHTSVASIMPYSLRRWRRSARLSIVTLKAQRPSPPAIQRQLSHSFVKFPTYGGGGRLDVPLNALSRACGGCPLCLDVRRLPDRGLELDQRGVQVEEDALQVGHAPTTAGDAEAGVVAVAGQLDVHGLAVEQHRRRVDAVELGAVPVHLLAGAGHVRDHQVERRPRVLDDARDRGDAELRDVNG